MHQQHSQHYGRVEVIRRGDKACGVARQRLVLECALEDLVRAVEGRESAPSLERPRRRRTRHRETGRSVRQPARPHGNRRHAALRTRDQPLRSTPAAIGSWRQCIKPPPVPERFTPDWHELRGQLLLGKQALPGLHHLLGRRRRGRGVRTAVLWRGAGGQRHRDQSNGHQRADGYALPGLAVGAPPCCAGGFVKSSRGGWPRPCPGRERTAQPESRAGTHRVD